MDRVFLNPQDDKERHKAGREVSDPFRDDKAYRIGFLDEGGEGLRFGTGDQEGISQDQGDNDQLCKISRDKRGEDIAREHIQKEVQYAGNFPLREIGLADGHFETELTQEHSDNSEHGADEQEAAHQTLADPP